jgi:site-specific DNA recombinase
MKAALYARVSTVEQAEDGHSIDAQLDIMRTHCQRMGWEVVEEYVDAGISGTSEKRPALRALMRDAKARHFDVVVVHKLDRFFRNLKSLLEALDRLASYEVGFASVAENFDFSSPWGKLALVNLGILAEIYIDNLSAETSKGKRQRAKKGCSNASILPYGYTRNDQGEVVPDPFEAEGVRLAFETYAQGNVSMAEVAQLLNEAGHRTRRTTRFGSRPWSKDTVNALLRNPFYAGFVRHRKELFEGRHEPIIPRELWERTKVVRLGRTRKGAAYARRGRVYLLSGLVYCDACNEALRCQSTGSGYLYYRHTTRERGLSCPAKAQSVRAEVVDEQVAKVVCGFELPDAWKEYVLEELNATQEHQDLEAERKRLESRLKRLARAYIDAGMSEAEYQREQQEILLRLAQLENPKVKTVFEAGELLRTLGPVWERATRKEQRDILRVIFEAVYVNLDEGKITRLVPKPAFEVLFRAAQKRRNPSRV